MRDDFKKALVRDLAKRAGYTCSNPICQRQTVGPDGSVGVASIGVAAHITAAAIGGPRFDETLTPDERSSIENGIWLCQTCSRLIDSDAASHSTALLIEWKTLAEMRAYLALRELVISSTRNFEKLESKMPELVREMRADITEHPFTREFVILKRAWVYNGTGQMIFSYYIEDHEHLDGKLKMCENYGAIIDTTFNNVDRYEFTEDFADYLLSSA